MPESFLSIASNFITVETPAQVFSSEFCKIFKKFFFIDHLRWVAGSFRHKMQSKKMHYDSYIQWVFCLMVSIVSEVTDFYLLQRRI